MEKEHQSQKLNFLDVTIAKTGAGKYEIKIHRKNGIKNFQTKPNPLANPSLIIGIFESLVSRAKIFCCKNILKRN